MAPLELFEKLAGAAVARRSRPLLARIWAGLGPSPGLLVGLRLPRPCLLRLGALGPVKSQISVVAFLSEERLAFFWGSESTW